MQPSSLFFSYLSFRECTQQKERPCLPATKCGVRYFYFFLPYWISNVVFLLGKTSLQRAIMRPSFDMSLVVVFNKLNLLRSFFFGYVGPIYPSDKKKFDRWIHPCKKKEKRKIWMAVCFPFHGSIFYEQCGRRRRRGKMRKSDDTVVCWPTRSSAKLQK